MGKKITLLRMISRCLKNGKSLSTWAIEKMGKSIGLMGSTATRYARMFRSDGIIKKVSRNVYSIK
ncbi:MAG: hypothetical protein PHP92_04040 [Candidatus Nanoarchaeia archaeon]|nr:hypothetical protein [Candidatus Nanoarchaeia archaeon]